MLSSSQGENPATAETTASLSLPSQFSPIFLARPSFQPQSQSSLTLCLGSEEGTLARFLEWAGGGEEEDVSTPFLLELGVGGWWEQGGVEDLAAKRKRCLSPLIQPVVWNSGAHFPTGNKAQVAVGFALAQGARLG